MALSPCHKFIKASCNRQQIVELKMTRFSYWIRSIPHWWDLLNDPKTVQQWTSVAANDGYFDVVASNVDPDSYDFIMQLKNAPSLKPRQIRWVLAELATYAKRISHANECQV